MPTTTPPDDDPALGERATDAVQALWLNIQQLTATLIDVTSEDGMADLLAIAKLLAQHDRCLKCMTVVAMVMQGRSWQEIGERLNLPAEHAREIYEEAVLRWRAGDPAPWAPRRGAPPFDNSLSAGILSGQGDVGGRAP